MPSSPTAAVDLARPTSRGTLGRVVAIHLGLFAAVLLIYGQTAWFDFINYDDDIYVYENHHVLEGFSVEGLRWAFTEYRAGSWHPITWLSLMLDAEIYPNAESAGGYHFTNVLLHAANALLLFELLRRMTGALWPSALVAALLAVHPLHVESVAWVTERKDVLSFFFVLSTMLAYVGYARRPSVSRYLLVMALFTLSLSAKSMMVTLPCLLLLLDFWPLRRIIGSRYWSSKDVRSGLGEPFVAPGRTIGGLVAEKIPLFLLSIVFGVIGFIGQDALPQDNLFDTSLRFRAMNTVTVYMVYLRKLIWPSDLATLYPVYSRVIYLWQALAALAFLLGTTIFAIRYRRRWPWVFVGWLWFVGILFPVSSLFQLWYSAHSDRLVYFPAIGIYIAVVFSLAAAVRDWNFGRASFAVGSGIVLAAFSWVAYVQIGTWENSYTLFTRAIEICEGNLRAHKHRGWAYQRDGEYALAIADYDKVLEIAPDRAKVYNNRGIAQRHLGNMRMALRDFDRAIELEPDQARPYLNRGQTLEQMGETDRALRDYDKAIKLNPRFVNAYANRGRLHLNTNNYRPAVADFSSAIELNPAHVKSYDGRGNAYLEMGEYTGAIADFRKAIERNSGFAKSYAGLALALANVERYDQASHRFRQAIELAPKDVESLNNFAWFLATCDDPRYRDGDQAILFATRACELTQYGQYALLDTLAASYAAAGKLREAVKWQSQALRHAPEAAKSELELRLEKYRAASRAPQQE